jgi:hypothetical protein
MLHFSLSVFNILSLFSVLNVWIIIFYVEAIFWLCLIGVLEATCTWMGVSFSGFGKFSIILLSMLPVPLDYTYSPSMPMICRFSLLLLFQNSCTVHSYLFILFSMYLPFFLLCLLCLWVLKSLLLLVPVFWGVTFNCMFYLISEAFYFQIFNLFSPLRLSTSLLISLFMSYPYFIYLFICIFL